MRRFAHGLSTAVSLALPLSWLAATSAQAAPPSSGPSPLVSEVGAFHWSSSLAAPRMVRLDDTNGAITVSASPSDDGRLDVRAVVHDGDPSLVRIVAREEAGGVAVCVFFAGESPDGCHVGGVNRPSSNGHHHDVPTIELVARVPAGVALNATTLNGAIHARVNGGEVHAKTLNGDVEVSGGTVVEATTLNGKVDASFANAPAPGCRATFSSSNGNVVVHFPSGTNADVEVSTMHGEIVAGFPLAITSTPGGFGPKSGTGRIGSGGPRIEAKTLNGNVELRSGS
jgi:hypothetical protein